MTKKEVKKEVKITLRNCMKNKRDEYRYTSVETNLGVWKTQINKEDRPEYGYAQSLHIVTNGEGKINYDRSNVDWFCPGQNPCNTEKGRNIKPGDIIEVSLDKELPTKTIDISCGVTATVGGIFLYPVEKYEGPIPEIVIDQFENKEIISLKNSDEIGDGKVKIGIYHSKKEWTVPP